MSNAKNTPAAAARAFEARVAAAMTGSCGVPDGARVVVAVSGGADSTALLASLVAAGFDCLAAHCNFHLRGAESRRDMEFVQRTAEDLGVDLYIKNFDVPEYCRQTGMSVEMACRRLRYDWFTDLVERFRAVAIVVGHHRQDQAETFLLNLLRGTGIAGLTGMAARNGLVVRPLLQFDRCEIEEYLTARSLGHVTDSTNAQNDYRRNRLRNIILPALEQQFAGAADAILVTMGHLADNMALYSYAVTALSQPFTDADGAVVYVDRMRAQLPAPVARMLLFELLRGRGFNMSQVDNMLVQRQGTSATFDSSTYRAELSRGVVTVTPAAESVLPAGEFRISLRQPVLNPVNIRISEHHITEFRPGRDTAVMYLDVTALQPDTGGDFSGREPLFTIRHWRRGDRIRPYGMDGDKLISDVFADAKLDPAQKRAVWLLTRNGKVLWVIGLRASAHFALTPASRRYLRLEYCRQ